MLLAIKENCFNILEVRNVGRVQIALIVAIVNLVICSCHVRYAFQSESTLNSYLGVKELLA